MDGIDFVFNFDYDDICMIMKDVLENCLGKKFKENLTKIQKICSHLSLDTILTNMTNFIISESIPFPKWVMGYSQNLWITKGPDSGHKFINIST